MKRFLPLLALSAVLALSPAAAAQTPMPDDAPATTYDDNRRTTNDEDVKTADDQTIAARAMNTPELSMLVEALQKAGLAEAMKGEGPFTVFAPTNEAFDDADAEDLDAEALKNVLLYHVVEGEYEADDLNEGMMLKTMNGAMIGVNRSATDPTMLTVQQVGIVAADIEASNGVIHVINAVLMPGGDLPLGGGE